MQFYQRKRCNFYFLCKFVICLLFVSHVYLFPQPITQTNLNTANLSRTDSRIETGTLFATTVETLNSKEIHVNSKNDHEKPVFDGTITAENYRSKRSLESEMSATDRAIDHKEYERSSRQFAIPFMAVPANWIATFDPTNAVILTNNIPLRIWAIGNVAKFPTFIENVVQRIQSYYSTYKYHDLSRPAAHAIINPQYHQHEPDSMQSSDSNENTENSDSFEVTENDPIDEESTEFTTESQTSDYVDATTEINYIDLSNEATDTLEVAETNDSEEVFK